MNLLITGGAGFVGGALARYFRRADNSVVVFDNLHRRGSEWNVERLRSEGVTFVHGDVRNPADLEALEGTFDVLIEASAEPSVHAGIAGSPRYVLDTNLVGALNCLEFARKRCGGFVFLSTSSVYSIEPLMQLPLLESSGRFELKESVCSIPGVSRDGISESFPCNTPRSYYGASKLAAELLCQEYAAHAGLPVVINRCGVIAGPGQFGKSDQGIFTLWVAHHHFGRPLTVHGIRRQGTSSSRSASSRRSLRPRRAATPAFESAVGTHVQRGRGAPWLGLVAGIHLSLSRNGWARNNHCRRPQDQSDRYSVVRNG